MPAAASEDLAQKAPAAALVTGDLSGQLSWYYSHLFPKQLFSRWLRYGSDDTFARREISFTLPGDIYLRWQSFASIDLLMKDLSKLTPIKIDIGAVYNYPPNQKNSIHAQLTPIEKELVFDIDMTDYEDVMPNCRLSKASPMDACDTNWAYMATAVQVLDLALREDFGFRHIMWVYSGRRGIHCWVGDARARRLTNEQRSSVADYLYLRMEGRENAGRRQMDVTSPLHPSLARARRLCETTFRDVALAQQGVLDGADGARELGALVRARALSDAAAVKVERGTSGIDRWQRLERELGKAGRGEFAARTAADALLLRCTYPRLDVGVSKEINHLLKAPFCVHPKTGRVCVPFRAKEAARFVPGEAAPLLAQLLGEMREVEGRMQAIGAAADRLNDGVAVFNEYVRGIEDEVRVWRREERLEAMDARQAAEVMGS